MGYNAVDNGFLKFNHVRVPRRNMLMKHSKVDVDGTYHPPPVAKASYGTMVFVRSDIVMSAALYLKKGLTIAIRYNAVRRYVFHIYCLATFPNIGFANGGANARNTEDCELVRICELGLGSEGAGS